MNHCICVFCASSNGIAERYFELAKELGEEMARRGHRLVYGGGQNGLMGTVARAVQAGGGHVLGVIPEAGLGRAGVPGSKRDDLHLTCGTGRPPWSYVRMPSSRFRWHWNPGGAAGDHHPPESRLPPEADNALDGRGLLRPLLQMLEKTVASFAALA